MQFLKTIGWLVLYTIVFVLATFLASFFIAIAYDGSIPLEIFIINNLGYTLILAAVLVVIFGFIILSLRGLKPIKHLQFKLISLRDAIVALAIGAGLSFFLNGLLNLLRIDQALPDVITEQITEAIAVNFPVILLAIGLIVPFYEEIFFRGLLFQEIRRTTGPWFAVLSQGLLFGAFHLNWLQFIYAFPVGIILGLVYLRYHSIWAPILIHIALNSTSALVSTLLPESAFPTGFWLLLILGAGLLCFGLLYSFRWRPQPPLPEEQRPEFLDITVSEGEDSEEF